MLVRNDLRILSLYLDDNCKATIFSAIAKDIFQTNVCYYNKQNYWQQYNAKICSEVDLDLAYNRQYCLWRNTSNNFFDTSIFHDRSTDTTINITSILWDIIPRVDDVIFPMVSEKIYEDVTLDKLRRMFNSSSKDTTYDETIYAPKISTRYEFDCESCLRITDEMATMIRFLINTIIVEKLTNRLYHNLPLVASSVTGKRNNRNMVGNFPLIYYKLESDQQAVFSKILAKAVLNKDPGSYSMFTTKESDKVTYKGLGGSIRNTLNIYTEYKSLWDEFLNSIDKGHAGRFETANIRDVVFESYARLNIIKLLDNKSLFENFLNHCENSKDSGYSQLLNQVLLLLLFELPIPLNQFYMKLFISNEGVLFKSGRMASMQEINATIDYLHHLIFNLIPALDNTVNDIVDTIPEEEAKKLLEKILDNLAENIDTEVINQNTIRDKKSFDKLEVRINSYLGYRYNGSNDKYNKDSFFVDLIQRKLLRITLFSIEERKYIEYLERSLSAYDYIRLEANKNAVNNSRSNQYVFLKEFYISIFNAIQHIDDIKYEYRRNREDFETIAYENSLSEYEIKLKEVTEKIEGFINTLMIADYIWRYLITFYQVNTLNLGQRLLDIGRDITILVRAWINSESFDEGEYEKRKGNNIKSAKNGPIQWPVKLIRELGEKYDMDTNDIETLISMIGILDERFNISIRDKDVNTDAFREYLDFLHPFFCFLIDCMYFGHKRSEQQFYFMVTGYWHYRNNYTCKNL